MKYLLAGVIVVALLAILRAKRRRAAPGAGASAPASAAAAQRPGEGPSRMLQCAACGVHLPMDEVFRRGDEVFCCDAHARRPPSAGGGSC